MRQEVPVHSPWSPLAALALAAVVLLCPPAAWAKSCAQGSPAALPPETLWSGEPLQPVAILQDATQYDGNRLADHLYPQASSIDIENGIIFLSYWGGFQIWDTTGGKERQPQRLAYTDGWYGDFLHWIPGASEVDQFVYSNDAPEQDDTILAVGGIAPVGFSVWDTRNKSNPVILYQDHTRKQMQQVYAATINDRAYGFGAAFSGEGGVHVYDMTAARNFPAGCKENASIGERKCAGVYQGKVTSSATQYVHGMRFGNRQFIVRSAGVLPPFGAEIWDVSNPTGATLVTPVLTGTFTAGVALWENGGQAYLAVRTEDALNIFNVTSCLSGGCPSGPSPVGTPRQVALVAESNNWKSVTFSRSGSTPFLFLGNNDLCHEGEPHQHTEYLFDVSDPANPRDLVSDRTIVTEEGQTVDYWSWYYSTFVRGYAFMAPRGGKFNGRYFYRAALTIFDVHEWTNGAGQPPVPNFTWSPTEVYPDTPVTFTDTSTGQVTSRTWTFPDGSNPVASSVAYTFPAAAAGTSQPVSLKVTNAAAPAGVSTSKNVPVLNPAPSVTEVTPKDPLTTFVCQPVTFTAKATGRPPLGYSWSVLNSGNNPVPGPGATGNASTFVWNTGPADAGQYRGQVIASNQHGSPATATSAVITVQPLPNLPTGAFAPTADPVTTSTVQFHLNIEGDTDWSWDFDDDANPDTQNFGPFTNDPVNGPNPKHTYASTGARKVRVKVRKCNDPATERTSEALDVNVTIVLRILEFRAQCNFAPCSFSAGSEIQFMQSFEGDPESYHYDWDGNGTYDQTSNAPVLKHTYDVAGRYSPKLKIVRGAGEVVQTHPQINVTGGGGGNNNPAISVSGPSSGQTGQALSFTASASDCTPASTWSWNAGDGTVSGTGGTVSITWSTPGNKTVTVQNGGCSGAVGTALVNITNPNPGPTELTANFTFSPATPNAGQQVSFDASSSTGSPSVYSWNFGDGQAGSGATTTHVFQSGGTYNVKLDVSKPGNCNFGFCTATITKQVFVNGGPPPLVASFTTGATCISEFGVDRCTANVNQAVSFNSTTQGATSHTWDFGDGTSASGSQVAHTWTQPGSYTVRLTVSNGQSTASMTRRFVVSGPIQPSTKSVVLPWIAQSRGVFIQSSDLYVHNPSDSALEVTVQFLRRGQPEANPPKVTRTIQPHATFFVADALTELFGRESEAGFIMVTTKGVAEPIITSFNTMAQDDGGRFGQSIAGVSWSAVGQAATAPGRQHLVGLSHNTERLAYFGVTNPNAEPAVCRLRLFDKEGDPIGPPKDLDVPGFGQRQLQPKDIGTTFGVADAEDYRVEVEIQQGGRLYPYGANLRIATEDPSFVEAEGASSPSQAFLVGVLNNPGVFGSKWQTDVVLTNVSDQVVITDMRFLPTGVFGAPTDKVTISLQPGETRRLDNVLDKQWGLNTAIGVLLFESNNPTGVFPIIRGEIYNNADPSRRFGQTMSALTVDAAADAGESQLLVGLRQDADYRTVLSLYNPSATATAACDVIYRALDGTVVGTLTDLTLSPNKARQINPNQHPVPAQGVANGLTVEVKVKSGKLLTSAQVINNRTNDPAYVGGRVR